MNPYSHASAAAVLIRKVSHATLPGRSEYEYPSDVDAVISELQIIAYRLPQVLEQAADWLQNEATAGRIGHDQAYDPSGVAAAAAVAAAIVDLADAGNAADALAETLAKARRHTAHLTGVQP